MEPLSGRDSADRKALGAYFSDPDVTRYLCVNTVLPWLCHGLTLPLPDGAVAYLPAPIAAEQRDARETGLEYELRQSHVDQVRSAYPPGSAISPDECIRLNLDLPALVQDWLQAAPEEVVLRVWRRLQRLRVLDPTCGDGAFLLAALHVLEPVWEAVLRRLVTIGVPEGAVSLGLLHSRGRRRAIRQRILAENLNGVDLDPRSVSLCEQRLRQEWEGESPLAFREAPGLNLRVGNAVAGLDWHAAFPEALRSGGFDVVVGNPPYVGARSVDYRAGAFRTAACPNVYAWVTEQALRLLDAEGRCGLILPVSAVSGPEYRPLAELYLRHHCWISTYSNRPAKLFEGVEQRLAVLLTGPARGEPGLWTTAYQHWYEAERPELFQRLRYTPGVTQRGFPAKLGEPIAVTAFRKLHRQAGTLLSAWQSSPTPDTQHPAPAAVWLHDGPTYWIRALPFRPNPGQERPSSHYHRISVAGAEKAAALAAVLSSSTFYFWFKAVSNCRDLGRQEWEAFPVGEIEASRFRRLAALGRELGERLRATARQRQRKYPSGVSVYEEYYPARAVEVLDRIDEELAAHFGFSPEESRYVRELDRRYRLRGAD